MAPHIRRPSIYIKNGLFFLVSVSSQSLFPFVCLYFMSFPFPSARHLFPPFSSVPSLVHSDHECFRSPTSAAKYQTLVYDFIQRILYYPLSTRFFKFWNDLFYRFFINNGIQIKPTLFRERGYGGSFHGGQDL